MLKWLTGFRKYPHSLQPRGTTELMLAGEFAAVERLTSIYATTPTDNARRQLAECLAQLSRPADSYSILAFAPDQPQPQPGYFWCWCPICKTAGITLGGEGSWLPCTCRKLPSLPTATQPRLRAASAAVCQAHFEHGETPG